MNRLKNILCLVDASAKCQVALHRAVELAARDGANVKIVDVIDDTPSCLSMILNSHANVLVQERRDQLQSLATSVRGHVPNVTAELLQGRPALSVVREVLRHGFDLVVKDARGTSQHKTLLLGSIDMRLLRNCPCPVWLNTVHHGRMSGVVLAAVDPLASDREHQCMNQLVLELASLLASLENAELHVVSAWEAYGESLLRDRVSRERLLEYIAERNHAAKQGLDHIVRQVRPRTDKHRVFLRHGEPAEVILDYARDVQCDLLVMGTVAVSVPGLLMGNTADTVLRQVECSVVTVKPASFVSPVSATVSDR